MSNRISQCFARAKIENRAVLGIFVSAGDPSAEASANILDSLVENGADFSPVYMLAIGVHVTLGVYKVTSTPLTIEIMIGHQPFSENINIRSRTKS